MADNEEKTTYYIGATDYSTAEKYIQFLERHTRFGGHTGLSNEIRNKKPNRSLDFSSGIYDTVDIFAVPPNKCPIGTVVNFVLDDEYNPDGVTYAYPCTDVNAPMGYMITNASPDVIGVCVVHGVIEVPLVYPKGTPHSEIEKKDYVKYDIEDEAFKFADSGYPVFNVYQDADGDWIAIILFGNVSADWQYDGPFATTIAGVTGSTMYVNVLEGDIVDKHYRYTCAGINSEDEDLTDDICLNTGETLWLGVYGATIAGWTGSYFHGVSDKNTGTDVVSEEDININVLGGTYTFFASSGVPVDITGLTSFYRIAENVDGKLRQLQYGDIIIDGSGSVDSHIPPYHALGVSGSAPNNGLGHTFILPVKGGTVGFWDEGGGAVGVWCNNNGTSTYTLTNKVPYDATEDGWLRISVIDDGTSDGECLSFFSATGGVPLYKYCAVSGGTGGSGGGGGIGFPDYSLLGGSTISISGTTGYTGVGVTYLIPVPGGVSIEYETEAPECIDVARFASFLDSANSVSHDLVIDTPWQTPNDGGWVRISVLDNGLHREGCLRFFVDGVDWSNALPLYRYGDYSGTTPPPAYSYTGPFAVNAFTISGTTAGQPVVVDGSTIGIATGSTTNYVTIYDTNNRALYNQYSGQVHIGEQSYKAPFYRSIFEAGESIYLVGTFDSNNPSSITNLEFRRVPGYAPTGIQDNQFYARICYSINEKMYQTQYGDIIQPARYVGDGSTIEVKGNTIFCIGGGSIQDLTSNIIDGTVTGGTACIGLTGSLSHVNILGGSNTLISDDGNGNVVIDCGSADASYTGPFAVSSWDTKSGNTTIHHYSISDTSERSHVSYPNDHYAGWVHIGSSKYPVAKVTDETFTSGKSIYLTGTFNQNNDLTNLSFVLVDSDKFPVISSNSFCVRIAYSDSNGKMHQAQYGDIIQPARYVGDNEFISVVGNTIYAVGGMMQNLEIEELSQEDGYARFSLTGSTESIQLYVTGGLTIDYYYGDSTAIVIGSTNSGELHYPNYNSLTNDSTGSLITGATYYVDSGGWLRVSAVGGGSTCCFVMIDGSYSFGLGNTGNNTPGMTWLLPIGEGHSFFVGAGASLVKFDGSCHQVTSGGAKFLSRGIADGSLEKKSQNIMDKYSDGLGFDNDYDSIKSISINAENSKDEVANICRTIYSHNRSFVLLSSRCELSAIHAENLCMSASILYQDALDTEKVEDAQGYLSEADYYTSLAYTWLNNASAYITNMEDIYNDDEDTDYDTLCLNAINNTSRCYADIVSENDRLSVIGVTGGTNYIEITERCMREANEWYNSTTEELNNETVVYSSSYKLASDSYDDVHATYGKLVSKGNEARVYVAGLNKSIEKK